MRDARRQDGVQISLTIVMGGFASISNHFPHRVVEIHDHSVISIDRMASGALDLTVDMRGANNRILLRLNKNGFRSAGIAMLRPDKSTVIFEDAVGNEMFRATYLNRNSFVLSGYVISGTTQFNLDNPNFHNVCMIYGRGADLSID